MGIEIERRRCRKEKDREMEIRKALRAVMLLTMMLMKL